MKINYIKKLFNINKSFIRTDDTSICCLVNKDVAPNTKHITMGQDDWFESNKNTNQEYDYKDSNSDTDNL